MATRTRRRASAAAAGPVASRTRYPWRACRSWRSWRSAGRGGAIVVIGFLRAPVRPVREASSRIARCSMSVDANIDATCIARHRSADGYWFSRRGRRLFGWHAASAAPGPGTRYHRIVSVTGPLQLIQGFANTLDAGSPATDQLGTREEAAAWLRAAGLLPAEAGLSNSEHAALVRLRDSIRDVLAAHTRGREDGDAAARLTKALADGRLVLTVDAVSAVQLASAARSSYPNLV